MSIKHYAVIVTRETTQSAQVYVSAENADDAKVLALELDADQYEWEDDEHPVKGEVYITDVAPDNTQ